MFKKEAFTLIELLVVIAIIGILSGILILSLENNVASAYEAKAEAELSQLVKNVLVYKVKHGSYPVATCTLSDCPVLSSAIPNLPLASNINYESDGSTFIARVSLPSVIFESTSDNPQIIRLVETSLPTGSCGEGWIAFNDKCIMMYEAKNVSGVATSQADGSPWINIDQAGAKSACEAIGAHLITNEEWMALARDAESVSSNWSGGVMARGWASAKTYGDTWSNSAVAPSTGSSCLYNIEANTCGSTGSLLYRRTLTLSNGEEIWDFSGNVWEWVDKTLTNTQLLADFSPQATTWYEYNGTTALIPRTADFSNATYLTYSMAGPLGTYNADNGVGRIYISTMTTTNPSGDVHAFVRGGYWASSSYAGAFALNLDGAPEFAYTSIGFRCVK